MGDTDTRYWDRARKVGISSIIFPLIILLTGIIFSKKGLGGPVENYEQGIARIVQYVLFGLGVAVFFFCDGISDFLAHRLFVPDKQRENENLSSYLAYSFIILWLLNMITVMGFIGFLISGNITWLTVFVILTISLQTRYFPSRKRFSKLIQFVEK